MEKLKRAEDFSVHDELPPRVELDSTRQTLAWQARPLELLEQCKQRYGDAFTLHFGSHGLYAMFSSPEAIREIFNASNEVLHAGRGNRVLEPLLGPRSLLLLEGQRHVRERRLLLPGFHAQAIERYAQVIQCATVEMASEVETSYRARGERIPVQALMQAIAVRVILQAIFGMGRESRRDELGAEIQRLLDDSKLTLGLLERLHVETYGSTWDKLRGLLKHIHVLLLQEVARRRTYGPPQSDLLGLLLAATYEDGSPLDDLALRDELTTLIVTGYETTATALTWSFYWLAREPSVLARLRSELAPLGCAPRPTHITQVKYLRAVCLETLRIRPIIPIVAREAQSPVRIQGYTVPSGVTVAAAIHLAHHRRETFDDPEIFRPERFLERTPSPFEFLPFGGGVRRCIGMTLALTQMQIVLATLLANFDVVPMDHELRPARRFVTLAPERIAGEYSGPWLRPIGQ